MNQAKGKVALERERESTWNPPGHTYLPITQAYPFFRSRYGGMVHRIRSGQIHIWHGKYRHTHFRLWCGQTGFSSTRNGQCELFAEAPERAIFCATCEGRATGAGANGDRMIHGRKVLYSPRRTEWEK